MNEKTKIRVIARVTNDREKTVALMFDPEDTVVSIVGFKEFRYMTEGKDAYYSPYVSDGKTSIPVVARVRDGKEYFTTLKDGIETDNLARVTSVCLPDLD